MDWLRFYWDYRTNDSLQPQATHWEILRHVQFTRESHAWLTSHAAYDRLLEAINDPVLGQTIHEPRWSVLADINGTDQ
jgi:hypothetical protein